MKKSIMEVLKHDPKASVMLMREKTKTRINMIRGSYLGSVLNTNDRLMVRQERQEKMSHLSPPRTNERLR